MFLVRYILFTFCSLNFRDITLKILFFWWFLVLKPQWKASIDFKWIRDNKEAVALNIQNRNSNANLELVIELYEKLLNVQKVRFLIFFSIQDFTFFLLGVALHSYIIFIFMLHWFPLNLGI